MEKEINILEVYDFDELRREMSCGANQTLEKIEEKELIDEFLDLINGMLIAYSSTGHPMTLEQLDDYIDYEADDIQKQLNVDLWNDEEDDE